MATEIKTVIFGTEVPGNAQVGEVYGKVTTNGIINIIGLQCTVNGQIPDGADLVFYMQIDGSTEFSFPITVSDGSSYGSIAVSPNIQVYDGSIITFICSSVGSVIPGSWLEIRMNVECMVLET